MNEIKNGEFVRRWDENHSRVVQIVPGKNKLDAEYLRDTGTMIYTTKGKGNSVINIVRTTIQRPAITTSK